jgi:hypothetical protein
MVFSAKFNFMFFNFLFFSSHRVIVGAPMAETKQYQQGVEKGGSVYRCDISDDNRCQIIPFDSNGELRINSLFNPPTQTNQTDKQSR